MSRLRILGAGLGGIALVTLLAFLVLDYNAASQPVDVVPGCGKEESLSRQAFKACLDKGGIPIMGQSYDKDVEPTLMRCDFKVEY